MKEVNEKDIIKPYETNFLNDISLYPVGLEYANHKIDNYYIDIRSACKNNNFSNALYRESPKFWIEQSWNEISSEKRWEPV